MEDVDPVLSGAARTPFESTRRVFVIERAETMNDSSANRLLKTLEEPPAFVHIMLLTDRPAEILPTIVSRCQAVRFDPLPDDALARALGDEESRPTARPLPHGSRSATAPGGACSPVPRARSCGQRRRASPARRSAVR